MDTNERILNIVREKGPILPAQVSKEIDDNILMTSARLSELLTSKKIKISNVKIGNSPLYYYPGQESKLQNFSENLQEIEKKSYSLLEQNKILRDSKLDPAMRVALRQIKDFAIPLQVNYDNKTEIFWKWYLADKLVVNDLIKRILTKSQQPTLKEESVVTSSKKEAQPQTQKPTFIKETVRKRTKPQEKNKFIDEIHSFFDQSKISIKTQFDTKKSSDLDFIIELRTTIGNLKYFCKSKNKKKINDADISSAIIQAQSKNLPLLFITNGDLTKKSKVMLENEFKNVTFKKIS